MLLVGAAVGVPRAFAADFPSYGGLTAKEVIISESKPELRVSDDKALTKISNWEFVDANGKLDPTKSDIMETRRQWLPESLQLDNEAYRRIAQLFLTANFTPMGGKYRNYSLHFQDERKLQFNDTVIAKVTRAIAGLKAIILENSG